MLTVSTTGTYLASSAISPEHSYGDFMNTLKLRDHTIGALAVAFVASLATMALSMMAKVGPVIFSHLTVGLGVITCIAVAAAAVMLAILVLKQ